MKWMALTNAVAMGALAGVLRAYPDVASAIPTWLLVALAGLVAGSTTFIAGRMR